jgi:hypothetical protein
MEKKMTGWRKKQIANKQQEEYNKDSVNKEKQEKKPSEPKMTGFPVSRSTSEKPNP